MAMRLEAGIGRSDITPTANAPSGIWKTQRHIRAEGIHLPLSITCLWLSCEGHDAAILSFDLCFLSAAQASEIASAIASSTGLSETQIFLFSTHTHAPPLTMASYQGPGADEVKAYVGELSGKAVEAVWAARNSLAPASVGFGHGASYIGANRNYVTNDGRTIVAPNRSGFMDPDVGVIRIDHDDGTPYGCIVSYGCHPHVLGPENTLISPDYPGTVRAVVEELSGATCIFLQAAGGNVCPVSTFQKDVSESERLGRILGCEATKILLEIQTGDTEDVLDHVIESAAPLGIMKTIRYPEPAMKFRTAARFVRLPIKNSLTEMRAPLLAELSEISARIKNLEKSNQSMDTVEANQADIERMRAQNTLSALDKIIEDQSFTLAIKALRINQRVLVATEGEIFAEIGKAIKDGSPFADTIFAAYLDKTGPYLGPEKYHTDQPGYEIARSPFAPDAAEILISETIDLLNSLFYDDEFSTLQGTGPE